MEDARGYIILRENPNGMRVDYEAWRVTDATDAAKVIGIHVNTFRRAFQGILFASGAWTTASFLTGRGRFIVVRGYVDIMSKRGKGKI